MVVGRNSFELKTHSLVFAEAQIKVFSRTALFRWTVVVGCVKKTKSTS